ncbi:MAG: hypothetical protein KA746_08170 [Pyrinomonadaceae bacterium]|nr:hypothetical protein [Pyrinomonadaceae bacterium]MBP6213275.1 hypothetical protein [Pyrinomonadaceae bacterium]
MIRKLVAKLNRRLSEKMVSARRRYTAPVKVWFDPDINSERNRIAAMNACLLCETVDMSRSGIAFLSTSIRVNEKYLVGHERRLNIEIDLPNGKIRLTALGKRYEKVGLHQSTERFLIGAHITGFEPGHEEAYLHFLKHGRRARKAAGTLELGID